MAGGSPEEQLRQIKQEKMLLAEDVATNVLWVLTQPHRSDVVLLQVRPHLQEI